MARGKKIIKTRWIDVNKGDEEKPDLRSRLVGKDYADSVDRSVYAATHPVEAMRLILSVAATTIQDGHRSLVMSNDVRRADFHAAATREVFDETRKEYKQDDEEDMIGRLELSLYGIRDAANPWQETVAAHLESLGFQRRKAHPAVSHQPGRDILT